MFPALTSSFHPPLFLNRHNFFLRISSINCSPLDHMAEFVTTTPSSSSNSAVHHHNYSSLSDGPIADSLHVNEDSYIMFGTIRVSLLCKRIKKFPLCFPTNCTPSPDKHPESESSSYHLLSPQATGFELAKMKRRTSLDLGSPPATYRDNFNEQSELLSETSATRNFTSRHYESLQGNLYLNEKISPFNREYNTHSNSKYAASGHKFDSKYFKPFDICFRGRRNPNLTGFPVHERNKESFIGMEAGKIKEGILRPGMVLLKHYLKHDVQVEIVKICRKLGMGPGGFYRPGYGDGAKLRLLMMCLGQDWDPQTRKYGKKRAIDGSTPPCIPQQFSDLVIEALEDARYQIQEESGASNVEDVLPSIIPDICIVNFYNAAGRLGLHQDRDESRDSLRQGLPVVSFSIGDSALFLYGDERNVETAEKVILESGDVLIFGGESRHVFHGVSSIIPDSAPEDLLKDTCLRQGRLNLTFRQY